MITFRYIHTMLGEILAVQGENGIEQLSFPCNGIKAAPKLFRSRS